MASDLPVGKKVASATPTKSVEPDNTFQGQFFDRLGDLALPFVLNKISQDMDEHKERLASSYNFKPRQTDIYDQRGMNLQQMHLLDAYMRAHGFFDKPTPFDPEHRATPLEHAAGLDFLPMPK